MPFYRARTFSDFTQDTEAVHILTTSVYVILVPVFSPRARMAWRRSK